MKTSAKLLLTALAVCTHLTAGAQYYFTPTIQGAGSFYCRKGAEYANSMLQGFQVSGIPTRSECEKIRAQVLAIKVNTLGCNIYYTCTPCVGTDMNAGMDANEIYSVQPTLNQGVEVRNGIDDYNYMRDVMETHNALDNLIQNGNSEYSQILSSTVGQALEQTGANDISFELKRLIPNVENKIDSTAEALMKLLNAGYGTDTYIAELLKQSFMELTTDKINVADFINKNPLSLEDKEILNRYNEFCDRVLEKVESLYEFPELEMAYYAAHVYSDNPQYDHYCAPLTNTDVIPNPDERDSAQRVLDFLKEKNDTNGFQADLYYDADKDSYILSFRGTEGTKLNDWFTDGANLATGISGQHSIASMLADELILTGFPMDKLTITGHSLGGSLALIAGLKTGAETYVYNPLHINRNCADAYNLNVENDAHIHTYEMWGEGLVAAAEKAREKAGKFEVLEIGTKTVITVPESTGPKLSNGLNHKIGQIIDGIEKNGGTRTTNFLRSPDIRPRLKTLIASKPYRQAVSAVKIDSSNFPFASVAR